MLGIVPQTALQHSYTCIADIWIMGSGDLIVSHTESLVTCVATTVMSQQGLSHEMSDICFVKTCTKLIIIRGKHIKINGDIRWY